MVAAVEPLAAPGGPLGGSRLVAVIEAVYELLRVSHPELPDVIVTTGSGRTSRGLLWGSHTDAKWRDAIAERRVPELFISGECLSQGGAFVLLVIVHEAAHALGAVRGIRNCSGQSNRYHNGEFRKLAEELGAWFPFTEAHPEHGYSAVELTDDTLEHYEKCIQALDDALAFVIDFDDVVSAPGGDGGTVTVAPGEDEKPPSRNNDRYECACDPPRIMRMAKTKYDVAPVLCGACEQAFE